MAGRYSFAAAVMAVVADSFLLPPSIAAEAAEPAGPDMSTWTLVDPNSQLLLVPCQGCKVDGSAGDSNLLLNLTVGTKPDTIELGGEVVYPLDAMAGQSSNPTVLQVPPTYTPTDDFDGSKFDQNRNVLTGWVLATGSENISEDGDEIVSVGLDITSIGSHHVYVPHVDFKILKNPEGHMMILSSDVAPFDPSHAAQDDCTSALCRFRQIIENRLHELAAAFPKSVKGCMGMKGHGRMRPHSTMDASTPAAGNGKPAFGDMPEGPHAHKHGRKHHSTFHRIMHRIARLIMAVALPLLVGVAAGVITYGVGMLIGCGIVLLWVRHRRGSVKYDAVALHEEEALIKDLEADGAPRASLESAPPLYEDAPAYEEKEVVA